MREESLPPEPDAQQVVDVLAGEFRAAAITGPTFAGVQDYISDLFTGLALVVAVGLYGDAEPAPSGRRDR